MSTDDRPILICFDGTPEAARAIALAADLVGPRRAIVLDVGPVVTPLESLALASPVTPVYDFEDDNARDAAERARTGAELARKAGFDAEPRAVVEAPIWGGIVDTADEIDAALIVMGSRGLSGLRELADGSISRAVSEHVRRPVLVVPHSHR